MQNLKSINSFSSSDSVSNTESQSKTRKNSAKIDFVEAAKIDIDHNKKLLSVSSFIG